MKLLIQLVREILHLSGKSQGKVREFQTPMAVATMLCLSTVQSMDYSYNIKPSQGKGKYLSSWFAST